MASNEIPDYYSILECDRFASKETIREKYKEIVLKCHPDKSDSPQARKEFDSVYEAFNVLSDETKRRDYDDKLIVYSADTSLINEEVSREDFILDNETRMLCLQCRCGGCFSFPADGEEDNNEGSCGMEEEEDPSLDTKNHEGPFVIPCDSCSLCVLVKPNVVEKAEDNKDK